MKTEIGFGDCGHCCSIKEVKSWWLPWGAVQWMSQESVVRPVGVGHWPFRVWQGQEELKLDGFGRNGTQWNLFPVFWPCLKAIEEPDRKKATKDPGVMLTAQVECCLCPGTGGSTLLVMSYLHSNHKRQSQFLFYRWGNKSLSHLAKLRELLSYILLNCQATIVGTWSEQMIRGDSVWGEVPFLLWDPGKGSWIQVGRRVDQLCDPISVPVCAPCWTPYCSLQPRRALWRMLFVVSEFVCV